MVKEAEAEVEWGVRLFYLEVAEEAEAEAEEEWGGRSRGRGRGRMGGYYEITPGFQ